MPRKGHRKSRAGCAECKRRHIKCDEVHPICGRCALAARQCTYYEVVHVPETSVSAALQPSVRSSINGNQVDDAESADNTSPGTQDLSARTSNTRGQTEVKLQYLELFYNFEHETCKTIARTEAHVDIYRRVIIRRSFSLPHLMYAVLGLSALHLASTKPSCAESYKHTAATLQAQALEKFDTAWLKNVDESNVLDLLLFQHTIALHVFCDIFASLDDDFSDFMDRLVGCIRLLNGIQLVISPWWDVLSRSEMGIIMEASDSHQNSPHQSLDECKDLEVMATKADLSAHSIAVCLEAIAKLQSYFDAEDVLEQDFIESTNMLFAWLVTADAEYTELLEQRKPEALVILAYYAVLLHKRRRSWAVGHAGRRLLQHIERYLGKRWTEHLTWPRSVVFQDARHS